MNLDYIKEYVVFAQYLNVTKAAAALYVSKSSLSKHIRQLENSIGFQLIEHYGTKCNLTREGECFYNAFVSMLNTYSDAVEKCERMRQSRREVLRVQEPSYSDSTAMRLYELISQIEDTCSWVSVQYRRPQRKDQIQDLATGKMDVILLYAIGEAEVAASEYHSEDLAMKRLTGDCISIWCNKRHALAQKANITFGDLRKTAVLSPNDVYAPLRDILVAYGEKQDFKPNFLMVSSEAPSTFLSLRHPESVYAIPASAADDVRIKARTDMVLKQLEGGTVTYNVYAVMRRSRLKSLPRVKDLLESEIECDG